MEENRLLSESQIDFQLKRSTSTALIAFTNQSLETMDKGCLTGTVFLDLPTACDTVDYLLPINKLNSLGVAGKNLEWRRSYLSGRVQQKMCDNVLSSPAKITMAVPAGQNTETIVILSVKWNSICTAKRKDDHVC